MLRRSASAFVAQRFVPVYLPIQSRLSAPAAIFWFRLRVRRPPLHHFRIVASPSLRVGKNAVGSVDLPEPLSRFNLVVGTKGKEVGVKLLHQHSVGTFDLFGLCCPRNPESLVVRSHGSKEAGPPSPEYGPVPTAGSQRGGLQHSI